MLKSVGLSRSLKKNWLDYTIDLVSSGKDEIEIKKALNEYLGDFIGSEINIRKTRELLMNIWVYPDETKYIRQMCIAQYLTNKDRTTVLHWCLMLLKFPIFVDITSLIGKISSMQDTFSLSWLKSKIYEEWGERVTLSYSLEKIIGTLVELDVIKRVSAGVYSINQYEITNPNMINIIIKTIVGLKQSAYYEISDLSSVKMMFPFKYSVSMEIIHNASDYEVANIGGKIVIVS